MHCLIVLCPETVRLMVFESLCFLHWLKFGGRSTVIPHPFNFDENPFQLCFCIWITCWLTSSIRNLLASEIINVLPAICWRVLLSKNEDRVNLVFWSFSSCPDFIMGVFTLYRSTSIFIYYRIPFYLVNCKTFEQLLLLAFKSLTALPISEICFWKRLILLSLFSWLSCTCAMFYPLNVLFVLHLRNPRNLLFSCFYIIHLSV